MYVAVALMGLVAGQPAEPEYFSCTSRKMQLPIVYKKDRKAIREVRLFVSRDKGSTWELAATSPPDKDAFAYATPEDGLYWFHLVTVDLKGQKDPADLTKELPALKILVDTVPPAVKFTEARRQGGEVVLVWTVEDKHPDEDATKVFYRPAGSNDASHWKEVSLPVGSKSSVRFDPGFAGGVEVKVVARDLVGKKGEALRELPALGGLGQTTTSYAPAAAVPAAPTVGPKAPVLPAAAAAVGAASPAPFAPPELGPIGPVGPPPVASGGPPLGPDPTAIGVADQAASAIGAGATMPVVAASPVPIAIGHGTVAPAETAGAGGYGGPEARTPIASNVGTAVTPTGSMPVPQRFAPTAAAVGAESMRAQAINYLRFDLAYEVEQKGPSGISRVDLWATRDEGRTWVRWSQHDGRETPIRVALDGSANRQLEGPYGFRLVPVSGAGLSDNAPGNGDAPDLRVVVDVTPPTIKLFQPHSDPNAPDALVIPWEATDKNFGEEPISLDWSENLHGPWKPIVAGAGDGIVPISNSVGPVGRRLPNAGRYAWRVPGNLPTHRVYLKVSARDLAGNVSEAVTPTPVLVDLAKPRARIHGIVSPPSVPRP